MHSPSSNFVWPLEVSSFPNGNQVSSELEWTITTRMLSANDSSASRSSQSKLHSKQPLTPTQHKIVAAYPTVNHRLAIETRRWSTIPISRYNWLCHFCAYNVAENKAIFVSKCSLHNPVTNEFLSTFENVVLGTTSNLYVNQIIKLRLVFISHMLPHSATLGN